MSYEKIKENRENASDDERTELSTNSDHNSNQHEEAANSPTSNAAFGPGAAAGLNLGKFFGKDIGVITKFKVIIGLDAFSHRRSKR